MDTKNDIIVWPSAMCIDENRLWIYHGKVNALFRYDFNIDQLEYICHPFDEDLLKEYSICSLLKVADEIYMIPCWGNHIHVYDINKREERIIEFPEDKGRQNKMLFCKAFIYETKVYCIPASSDKIVVIMPESGDIKSFDNLYHSMKKDGVEENIINDADIDDEGRIIATISGTNKLVLVDIKNEKIEILQLADNRYRCSMVVYTDGYYFVSAFKQNEINGVVFKYDLNQRSIQKVLEVPCFGCSIGLFGKKHLIADSYKGTEYIIFDENLNVIKSGINDDREYDGIFGYSYRHGVTTGNDSTDIYFDRNGYKLHYIDGEQELSEGINLTGKMDLRLNEMVSEAIIENTLTNFRWYINELERVGDNNFEKRL